MEGGAIGEAEVSLILTRAVHRHTNQAMRELVSAGDLLRARLHKAATCPDLLGEQFTHDSRREMWPPTLLSYAVSIQPQVAKAVLHRKPCSTASRSSNSTKVCRCSAAHP